MGNSQAPLIAVFDAHFVPRPDFLRHLVPYLDDESVGIVQSPQCFESVHVRSCIERAARAAQELFFRWMQPARDAEGAAVCCGTNAVYRRSAIEAAGGFPRR
jgi:cellulose synthase (UDP-forming)